ncbi:MAG: VWA domain-containing protein [Bacteroidales bacterium]|jgi:hypothetical protein|nr:VWA domain-containing protein [Bacteroidales bacterium]
MASKIKPFGFLFSLAFIVLSCGKGDGGSSLSPDGEYGGNNNENGSYQPGTLTAGEWNDLDNWSFWNTIISDNSYQQLPGYWKFYNNNRISVKVLTQSGEPLANAKVDLKRNSTTIFTAITDNFGKAELWMDLFQKSNSTDFSNVVITVNETLELSNVLPYSEGINEITVDGEQPANRIEIALVVDATGSMADELEFIKTELVDVVQRVQSSNSQAQIFTSALFYRDEGDEYVTRISNFASDISVTNSFINNQRADAGGDTPEAVHTALDKAINELQWSANAKTRLLFLILDAPPHYQDNVISSLQQSIQRGIEKGIKIIPITASGIDKETEFLMRFMAISTNGTYVFITDDSGVGNPHLTPTIGEHQVEYLNDLMVRLINKYSE